MGILFVWSNRFVVEGHGPRFDASEASHLIRFGGWVTVTSFVGPLMVIFDRFVIGAFMGAKAVTYYTVPFQITERLGIIPTSLTTAVFPRLSTADAAEEWKTTEVASRALVLIVTPLFIGLLLLIEPFLQVWIGRDFAEASSGVARIVLVSFWVNFLARIPYMRLQARGRPNLTAKTHLGELFPCI